MQTHLAECQLTLKHCLSHLLLENQPQDPRMLLLSRFAATAEQGARCKRDVVHCFAKRRLTALYLLNDNASAAAVGLLESFAGPEQCR